MKVTNLPHYNHYLYVQLLSRARVAYARDTVVDVLVIPSTCIRGRDIVIAPLVCVCVCVSVCLHLIAS